MATVAENPLVEGLERLPVHPTNMVIFGATGDLSKRKLLPAIYNLAHDGALPERFNLIATSRSELSDDDFRQQAVEAITQFSRRKPDDAVLSALLQNLRYVPGSFDDASVYERLASTLEDGIAKDVPMPVLTSSIFARFYSRDNGEFTGRMLSALRNQFGGHAVERGGA